MTPTRTAEAALAADRAHADSAIWITRLPDAEVLENARRLEQEGPLGRALWGVTFAVKDNIDVAGMPTTAACPGFSYTPDTHAPAVRRLLDAGALLLGKTNLDQFATGLRRHTHPIRRATQCVRPAPRPGWLLLRFGLCRGRRDRQLSRSAAIPPGPAGCPRRSATSSD